MSKNKKKRNKVYKGIDSAMDRPSITRISAANRSKIGQWWFEHKKQLIPIIRIIAIAIFVVVVIAEIIRLATGA